MCVRERESLSFYPFCLISVGVAIAPWPRCSGPSRSPASPATLPHLRAALGSRSACGCASSFLSRLLHSSSPCRIQTHQEQPAASRLCMSICHKNLTNSAILLPPIPRVRANIAWLLLRSGDALLCVAGPAVLACCRACNRSGWPRGRRGNGDVTDKAFEEDGW